jgi:lactate racemase
LGFTPFASVQEALNVALSVKGAAARVAILTHAPDMLPVICE